MMIQRIQTIYLVLVVVLCSLCFAFPIAKYDFSISGNPARVELNLLQKETPRNDETSLTSLVNTLPLMLTIVAVGALAIACIALFKNRRNQARCIAVTMLVNMIYIGLIFLYYVDQFSTLLAHNFKCQVSVTYSFGSAFPILSLIFLFMANKAVRKDEAKVRAADRLR